MGTPHWLDSLCLSDADKQFVETTLNEAAGKPVAPAPEPTGRTAARQKRLQQVLAGIKRWDSKLRRAENALVKLNRKKRQLERALAK